MTQQELQEQIKAILQNNGFIAAGTNALTPGVSITGLCSTLAARLIDSIIIAQTTITVKEGITIPPLEEKSMSVSDLPSEQPLPKEDLSWLTDESGIKKEQLYPLTPNEAFTESEVKEGLYYSDDMRNLMQQEQVGILLADGAVLPEYGTKHSSGFDLVANFNNVASYRNNEGLYCDYAGKFKKNPGKDFIIITDDGEYFNMVIMPGCSCPIPTGVYLEIPIGFEVQVRPRSGIATKQGLRLANCEGTIDADYRGEVIVALYNDSKYPQEIKTGMKIAQAVLCPVSKANFIIKQELSNTDRGAGGFNSTGTNIKTK